MATRIDLDFAHSLAEPALTCDPNGAFLLSLTRGQEQLVVRLSRASLWRQW